MDQYFSCPLCNYENMEEVPDQIGERESDMLQAVFDAVMLGGDARAAMHQLAMADCEGFLRDMVFKAQRKANPIAAGVDPCPLHLPVVGAAPYSTLGQLVPIQG